MVNFLTDNKNDYIVYIHRLHPYDFEVKVDGTVVLASLDRAIVVDRKTASIPSNLFRPHS